MVSKREGFLVLWPTYFDKETSRRDGRRIPSSYAVPAPSGEDIAFICSRIKLTPHLHKEVAHPREPLQKITRVLVRKPTHKGKKISKQKLLKIIGKRLFKWFSEVTEKRRKQQLAQILDKIKVYEQE